MIAEIIAIGDELLIGQVVNTNAAWLGEQLSRVGVPVRFMTTVGDNGEDILASLKLALTRADFIIATGGLGPTHDDITKKVVMEFFEAGPLVQDEKVLAHVRGIFMRRNIPMSPVNEEQALVPAKARVLWNAHGTAPGLLFEKNGKYCAVMPGVPFEMKSITTSGVLPFLRERADGQIIRHRTVRTFGIAESHLSEKLAPIVEIEKHCKLAFLPSYFGVNLRITVAGREQDEVERRVKTAEEIILAKAGKYVYGYDDDSMEEVVGRRLKEKKATLALAESCTGGLLAHRLTNVSGSSEYFLRGYVTYSNAAKIELLGVPEDIIAQHGAVSEPCALAMAAGAKKMSNSDYAVALTGIAGPSGGSPEKPVGTVWIALASPQRVSAKHFLFANDRIVNKERFAQAGLAMLYRALHEAEYVQE
jgi:nicotinamide-nucleotide amidase